MVLDVTGIPADEPQSTLPATRDRQRMEILRLLSSDGFDADRIAEELGLSRRVADRHLKDLQECGLVDVRPGPGHAALFTLNAQKAALLSASFVRMVGRAREYSPPARTQSKRHLLGTTSPVAPLSPEVCSQCENASFVGEVLGELDRSLMESRRYQDRLKQMASEVLKAQEEERKRIARELHDDTAQSLTSVLVRLRILERSSDDVQVRAGIMELRDLMGATLEGVRRLAMDLRPPMLDDLGLEPALRAYAHEFSRHWPVNATCVCGGVRRLPPEVELVLYRIVQEALSNVAKHANASRVDVRLSGDEHNVHLLVQDDGCGFDMTERKTSREAGLGLFGMEERLALVGGTLRVESTVGTGTRVSAKVHLQRS